MQNLTPLIVIGAMGAFFLFVMVSLLRRASRKKREMFADEPVRPILDDADPSPDPIPAPARETDAEAAPEPEPEPEPEPAEAAAELDPTPEPTAAPQEDAALEAGLEKTRAGFMGRITGLLSRGKVDESVLDELEEVLLTSDVGVQLTMRWLDELRAALKKLDSPSAVQEALRERMLEVLQKAQATAAAPGKPHVILFVGVNGVGKTTTIGKVAAQFRAEGKSVVMGAGDTFRAAAAEQLAVWAERTESKLIRAEEGADPASVVFNAVKHGVDVGADVVLADTAGRLHTKAGLMDEIGKIKRAATKARENAPDETWLVVDATSGQNALQQAKEFNDALDLSGVILTKLDGTAKGGVVLAIADAVGVPVRYVGVGEKAEDLRPFDGAAFVNALFAAA